MNTNPNNNYCLNCETPFSVSRSDKDEIYCVACGQSSKDSKLSFWKLIKDGVSNIFNLDSRIVHTMKDIIFPSKLTKTYISGKRKYYVNPVRLFIFTLLAIVTSVLWFANLDEVKFGNKGMSVRAEDSRLLDRYDSIVDTLDIVNQEAVIDTIRKKLFSGVKKTELDSIGSSENLQLWDMGDKVRAYGITAYDAVHLSKKEIYNKYGVKGFFNKIMVSQYIRLTTNPSGILGFVVKNLTWAVMITLILISFFLKLLYIRRAYYLVEHSVLLLNLHSFFFLLFGFALLLNTSVYSIFSSYSGEYDIYLIGVPILFAIIVHLRAIKNYYGHNLFVALIVQFIYNTAYVIIFFFSSLLVGLISVFLY